MSDLFYSICDEVFAIFPEYVRGVVLAYEVANTESVPGLMGMLRAEEASVRDRLKLEELTAHPWIASWREAFRRVGIKPSEFRASVEAITRRWSWRQANYTITLPITTAIEFNIDGLPPVTKSQVEGVCLELMELVQQFCGGQMRYEILSHQNPRITLKC